MSPGRAQSNAILREWCRGITGTVLSVGSSSDSDGDGSTYREYFVAADRYVTSEPELSSCDLVLDVRSMPSLADASVDAIFCSGVLEHVDDCWAAVRECWRILTVGGAFLVGVPFAQPLHRAPHDFWRFTEYGIRFLLREFRIDEIRAIGDVPNAPTAYWVLARKVAA
jgi:ubiquinone/menaquinone biosynthesis C-methylase UbiE